MKKEKKKNNKKFTYQRGLATIGLICSVGFIFVLWVIYLYPMVENSLKVWQLFVIFYVLVITFWMILFVSLFDWSRKALKSGIVLSVLSAIIDLYYPPFAVDFSGALVPADTAGYRGSIDYTIGYYLQCFGLSGPLVFIFTYLLIPILMFVVMLLIIKPDMFKKSMQHVG